MFLPLSPSAVMISPANQAGKPAMVTHLLQGHDGGTGELNVGRCRVAPGDSVDAAGDGHLLHILHLVVADADRRADVGVAREGGDGRAGAARSDGCGGGGSRAGPPVALAG